MRRRRRRVEKARVVVRKAKKRRGIEMRRRGGRETSVRMLGIEAREAYWNCSEERSMKARERVVE